MKVYGFDDSDVVRGELRAAEVDAADISHYHDIATAELGWEYMSTRFKEAQRELIARMEAEDSDPELTDSVRRLKAAYVPLD